MLESWVALFPSFFFPMVSRFPLIDMDFVNKQRALHATLLFKNSQSIPCILSLSKVYRAPGYYLGVFCPFCPHSPRSSCSFLSVLRHTWLISTPGPSHMLVCPGALPYLPFTSSVNPHQVSAQVSSPPRGLPWSPCLEYLCSPQFIVCLSHWNVNSRRAGTLFIVPYPKLRTMLGT